MEEGQNLPAKNFRDLRVWQAAFELTLQVYALVKNFPVQERYGLSSQMTRAAVSVCSNISEGFGRSWPKEKGYFYSIANGSLTELENQLLISECIGLTNRTTTARIVGQCELTHKMLVRLQAKNRLLP